MSTFVSRPCMWRSIGIALVSLVVQGFSGSTARAEWKVGDTLPALSGFGIEGALPDLAGKIVYVDFWASWCGPCKKSFDTYAALQKTYGKDGFVIVAVSVDDTREPMVKFLESRDVPFTIVRDATEKLVASAGIAAMPTSYLVDRKGIIRSVHAGYHGKKTDEALTAEIEGLLKGGD